MIVELKPGGERFECGPDEALLAAALRAEIPLPYGCRDGACGVCRARLVTGGITYGVHAPRALDEAERAAGFILPCIARPADALCPVGLCLEAEPVPALASVPVRTLPARVSRLERLAHDVMGVTLRLPGPAPFRYLAGQYVDILLKDGSRRCFSIANPPGVTPVNEIELHVRHMPGGRFSEQVFGSLKEKDVLRIQGPLGRFFLRQPDAGDPTRPLLCIAGGTGFAPIRAMIEHCHGGTPAAPGSAGPADLSPPPIALYCGVRARRDLYMLRWIEDWRARGWPVEFTPVLSAPQAGDDWQGRTGLVHEAVLADHADLAGFDAYVCGPPALIQAARATLPARGLPAARLFYDAFTAQVDFNDHERAGARMPGQP